MNLEALKNTGQAVFLNGQNKNLHPIYIFPLGRKICKSQSAAEGYIGGLRQDIHLKYNFSAVVGSPCPPSRQLSGLDEGEVTEL
jgi:hypothetical protein